MPTQLTAIGVLWPNKGFVGLSKEYGRCLKHAFTMELTPPQGQLASAEDTYLEMIQDWKGRGASFDPAIKKLLPLLESAPARRQLTISDLLIHVEMRALSEVRPKDIVWRWKYYEFAYVFYWALSFHLTNAELRDPEALWRELISFGRNVHPETNDEKLDPWKALLLALYERTIGMEADILAEAPHYVKNISDREGLSIAELQERVELFTSYKDFMKSKIVQALTA